MALVSAISSASLRGAGNVEEGWDDRLSRVGDEEEVSNLAGDGSEEFPFGEVEDNQGVNVREDTDLGRGKGDKIYSEDSRPLRFKGNEEKRNRSLSQRGFPRVAATLLLSIAR